MINKKQLVHGVSKYINEYMLPSITDMTSRRIMGGLSQLLIIKPDTFDTLMAKYPILDMFCENGMYDLEAMEKVLIENIAEYGPISFSLLGGNYTFDSNDISNVMRMM